jgi:hypothetical protein
VVVSSGAAGEQPISNPPKVAASKRMDSGLDKFSDRISVSSVVLKPV